MQLALHTAGLVAGPGFYDMPAALYHADPAPQPSLSSSVAVEILAKTPKHAMMMHPRLDWRREHAPSSRASLADVAASIGVALDLESEASPDDEAKKDAVKVGSVAHELLLGKGGGFDVHDFKDKRTKAAKEAIADSIAAGRTPILRYQMERAEKIVAAVRAAVREIPGMEQAFDPDVGVSEAALVWRDQRLGIWGRALVDRWGPEPVDMVDFKTTEGGLSDRQLGQRIEDGIDLQLAWYERGMSTLWPDLAGRIRYRVVFAEQKPPYEVRVMELNAEQREMGRRKMIHAAVLFADCLRTGIWPGYPREISQIPEGEFESFGTKRWLEREDQDPAFRRLHRELMLALSPQAPHDEAIPQ